VRRAGATGPPAGVSAQRSAPTCACSRRRLEADGAHHPSAAATSPFLTTPPLATAGDPDCLGADVGELAGLLRREQLNSYGVMAPPGPAGERRVRGGGLYPLCSLVNHECAPNAARFDGFDAAPPPAAAPATAAAAPAAAAGDGYPPSTRVRIRAMHDLPAGTEVVQSYFPLNWSLAERRRQAREVYGFECACPRCLAEEAPGWADGGGSGSSSGWATDDGGDEGEEEEEQEGEGSGRGVDEMEHEECGGDDACTTEQGEAAAAAAGPGSSGQQAAASGGGGGGGGGGGDDRGPLEPTYLQLFLLKYMCPREGCFGTMAAVPGGAGAGGACECNVCGGVRTEAEFLAELEASR
jgi:hypothetical protein